MNTISREPETGSNLLASCDLVPHPEGAFEIGGRHYRPEWGRTPSHEQYGEWYDRAPEVVHLAVEQANRLCTGKEPRRVCIQMYSDGRSGILVIE